MAVRYRHEGVYMRITLCYPPLIPGNKPQYGLPPMGILYIGSELQNVGHSVTIVDADIDGLTAYETAERILDSKPDLIGFSIMTPTAAVVSADVQPAQACRPRPTHRDRWSTYRFHSRRHLHPERGLRLCGQRRGRADDARAV